MSPEVHGEVSETGESGEGTSETTYTINLSELVGMYVTARISCFTTKEMNPQKKQDPITLRGGKASPVPWINRCGGAKDELACTVMIMLGRLEVRSG